MTIDQLYETIRLRADAAPDASYTATLLAKGQEAIARKLGEECIEMIIEATHCDENRRQALIAEAADLMYHYLVLLASRGISLNEVYAELGRREGQSGLDEKRSRNR